MKLIKFPQYFSYWTFDPFLDQVQALLPSLKSAPDDVLFDFSATEHVSELGLLLIAQTADNFRDLKCHCTVMYIADKEKNSAWLLQIMHLIKGDKQSQEVEAYLDSFRVPIQRCYQEKDIYEALNKKLIPVIRKEFNPSASIVKAINWVLWEAIGNSIVHGYSLRNYSGVFPYPIYFCAMSYEKYIRIAILDLVQGIHTSLTSSGVEAYKNITNDEALGLAIQNGVSGNPDGSPGFGLYGSAEIARQSGGELVIISEKSKLILKEGELKIEPSSYYQGTLVQLQLPSSLNIDLTKIFGKDALIATEDIDTLTGNFDD